MHRYELTDAAWARLEDLFAPNGRRGGQWRDHRTIVNGLFWVLMSGAPWRGLPERYGPWKTVYGRYRRWARDGTLQAILDRLHLQLDEQGRIDWSPFNIDGTSIRADRAAAGAGKKGARASRPATAWGEAEGVGASKLHLVTDGQGVPLAARVTRGEQHESTVFEALTEKVRVGRRRRPRALAGDKAYSAGRIRAGLRRRKIEAVIPQRADGARRRRGRPLKFDREKYRRRNAIERCVGWLKGCRRTATRHEKLATRFLAMVTLAMIRQCLRLLDS